MRYTLAQAEAFYWVARLGSFRAAADHLNLTQPTISLRVKELERIFGSALFDRASYKPIPTALAATILGDVERMLAQADYVELRAKGAMPARSMLRIGAAETFAIRILPDLLAQLACEREDLQVTVTVDLSTQLERMLLEHAIDIAFLADPRASERIRIIPLWEVEYVWVVAQSLKVKGDLATPEALAELALFTNGLPSPLHTTLLFWFGLRGIVPRRVNTCNTLPVIALLAGAGTGAALIPREMIEMFTGAPPLRVLDADPPVPNGNICAAWREGAPEANDCAYLTTVAQRLIRHRSGER